MTERSADVALVEEVFGVVADGGPQALLDRYDEFFAGDFEWRPALIAGVDGRIYRGREGFEQYWRDFTDAFEEIDFGQPQAEPLASGRVLAAATIRVRGAGGGVPIEQAAAYVIDIRDGLIVAGRTFFSRAAAEEFASA